MASPGLKPGLFFLALVTAKPAGGYGAAQWRNRNGPRFASENTEMHNRCYSVHLHL